MNASKTALLVLDIQPACLAKLNDVEKLIDNTKKLVEGARAKGITVIFVRVAFTDEEFQNIPSTNKTFSRFSKMGIKTPSQMGFHADDESAQIHPDLGGVQPNDIQIRKIRPGPFTNTDLHQQLQNRKIDNLVITGVATANAVLTTVRNGMDLDYGMIIVTDACADPDPELHNTMIKTFERAAEILTTEETLQRFSSAQ
ncbi:Isochorismatase hydrolase [Meira miltonrushii]|uniref:Isochorismatase hydrolase n=1 Tax=Meira miltonrushii TaxID=1280837 RepID=A0A316V742_9BASI|nr:Isochorismatase hydrolase [Meira miltonrushii]PWN31285.1 Isochorismatase hydrolase [Meira miltonrushii]